VAARCDASMATLSTDRKPVQGPLCRESRFVNEDGLISAGVTDSLVEGFLTSADVFVVDRRHCVSAVLDVHCRKRDDPGVTRGGRKVYLHVPVTGGEMLNDTLSDSLRWQEATTDHSVISSG